ncbi:MAG TPA: DoxX family protein [Mycobacteriales bacterium]|nr:DoxX family protein [Mycobacteriales bacterium]
MRVAAAIASAVLILELILSAIAMLSGMEAGLARFAELTRATPPRWLQLTLGTLDVAGVAGIIAGFWQPGWAVAAAAYFALFTGVVLYLQLTHGDRGGSLFAYGLFFACAVVVVVTRAAG